MTKITVDIIFNQVYIFRGGPKGIQSRDTSLASQVIDAARDIDPRLRGFGFSLAGGGGISNQDTSTGDNGLDLDGNKYPDLIVGSPFSGQAVYLRYWGQCVIYSMVLECKILKPNNMNLPNSKVYISNLDPGLQ